jgi:hypothetical protein
VGTRETVGDQRNILLSMTKKYHQMRTGLLYVRKFYQLLCYYRLLVMGCPIQGTAERVLPCNIVVLNEMGGACSRQGREEKL